MIITAAGRVLTDSTANPVDTFNGWPFRADGALMITNAAPQVQDQWSFANGKLCAIVAETPPVNFTYNSGLLVDAATGAILCNLTLPPVSVIQGLPVEANGTLCIA